MEKKNKKKVSEETSSDYDKLEELQNIEPIVMAKKNCTKKNSVFF